MGGKLAPWRLQCPLLGAVLSRACSPMTDQGTDDNSLPTVVGLWIWTSPPILNYDKTMTLDAYTNEKKDEMDRRHGCGETGVPTGTG